MKMNHEAQKLNEAFGMSDEEFTGFVNRVRDIVVGAPNKSMAFEGIANEFANEPEKIAFAGFIMGTVEERATQQLLGGLGSDYVPGYQ